MSTRKIIVVGTGSNVGKTTVTLGLMAAYKDLGYVVQGFKCGPDYIDPSFQTALTGRGARNLDGWMCNHDIVREVFTRGCEGADVAIAEGVMGMFDGKDPLSNIGSSAEIAEITDTPVLLVVDVSGMARSAAAMVKGYQSFATEVNICGVVANRVGSEGHFQLIKKAVEKECGVPVVGYLTKDERITLPERYSGLVPSIKGNEYKEEFSLLAKTFQQTFDLDLLLSIMGEEHREANNKKLFGLAKENRKVRIAVARDEVFHCYYEENLMLLEHCGAELVYFSPLKEKKLPENIDGLYIGGGFPEQCATRLSAQKEMLISLRKKIDMGLPTLAEGGGFMYLCESIETHENEVFQMVGAIPGKVKMETRMVGFGYRSVVGSDGNFLIDVNEEVRGHTYHYSSFHPNERLQHAYVAEGTRGTEQTGVAESNLVASYVHLHFGSAPFIAKNWVRKCVSYRNSK